MTQSTHEGSEIITFKNSQGLSARGTLLKISQNQIVFETYSPFSIVQLSEVLNDVKIYSFNEKAYVGKAVINSLINTGLMILVSATLVDPWIGKLNPEQLNDIENEAKRFVGEWENMHEAVSPGYQLAVNKMRSFLTDMSRWVRQFDTISIEDKLIENMALPLLSNLANLWMKFEAEASKVTQVQMDVCKKFVQQEMHPLMMQSPFAHRTYTKPLGYAGDYEMVNMMLRNPCEGETVYGKLLNLFFLKTGPAEAHRNRIEILFSKIKNVAEKALAQGRRAQILNFACGPAIEVQRFIEKEKVSENCDFTLLDFNQETLDYTGLLLEDVKKKSDRKNVKITLVQKSVNDILKEAIGLDKKKSEASQQYDFVYCAGLFDYLSDRICSKMLGLFFSQIRNDGELMATNVHSSNPVRALMEQIVDWYLVYRDEKSFSDLIDGGLKSVYLDKTSLNIFLEVRKEPLANG